MTGRTAKTNEREADVEVTTERILKAPRLLEERARECEYCHVSINGKLYKYYYKNSEGKAAVMVVCSLCRDLLKTTKGK